MVSVLQMLGNNGALPEAKYPGLFTKRDILTTATTIFTDNTTSSLISSGGSFELGFFSPNNSDNRYVGIWYWKIPVRTVVWVANKDNPLTGTSGVLKVVEPGILALLNENVIKEGGILRYRSGPWNGVSFSGSRNLRKNSIYTFGVVINEKEVYYHFELLNDSVYSRYKLSDTGAGQRWIWDYQKQSWINYLTVPSDNCDIYNLCGPHGNCNNENTPNYGCLNKFKPKDPRGWGSGDWSNGCNRKTPLNGKNGDAFLKYFGIKLPNTHHSWYDMSMTLKECKVVCLNNCSCMAYASLDIRRGENGCLLWFGNLVDIREMAPGHEIYIRMASCELDSGERKREIVIVISSLATGILLLCLSLMLYSQKTKKLNHQLPEIGRMRLNNVDNHPGIGHKEELELPRFDLAIIRKATESFSINNKLGEGGFGPVYKGVLEDGQKIAVKCLSKTSHQGEGEFKNEVVCIAKL
ncbi:hypothetical protein ACS0TY_017084 [Phlomoides rotata]